MPKPRHLFAAWDEVRLEARRYSRYGLFLDFDGTLAPIRMRPESVWIPSATRYALQRVVQSGMLVAIISGRSLKDVRRRAALDHIWYAGAHGYFLLSPQGRLYSLLPRQQKLQMGLLLRTLRAKLHRLRGIQVEPKEATVAIHYRRAAPQQTRLARTIVEELAASNKSWKLMHGKKVWEILPAVSVDKWTAIRFILREQPTVRAKMLLFYFGDDTTDESVFRRMKGISVAVGKRKGTAAKYFLRSPAEVRTFLTRWPELIR